MVADERVEGAWLGSDDLTSSNASHGHHVREPSQETQMLTFIIGHSPIFLYSLKYQNRGAWDA